MKLLQITIYSISTLFSIESMHGQPVYFSNRYNLCQNYNEEAWSGADGIIQVGDGYVISGYTVDTITYWWRRIPIMKIDYNGFPVWYKSFGDTIADYYTGRPGSFKKAKSSDTYFLAGSKNHWQPMNYDVGLLIRFDSLFETLLVKEYNLNNDTYYDTSIIFNQIDICQNSDLIFAGSMDGSHFLLLRTDSTGNKLWHKVFHYGSYTLCTGYSVIQTSDGGFALGGFRYTIGQAETGNPVILKTDSLGNQQWIKYMGGPFCDNKAMLCRDNDGNIVMGSTYGDAMIGDDPVSKINIAKLDNAGNIIWDRKYGNSVKFNYLMNIRILDNGDILAVGGKPDDYPHSVGWLLRVDKDGDSLWYREYAYLDGPESWNQLYDIVETTDHGIVSCGYIMPLPPDTGNRDAWVIKLDSIGCDWVGCDSTVGIEEHGSVEAWWHGGMKIWPNPASDWITLTLPEIVAGGKVELVVYDIFGRDVTKKQMLSSNRTMTYNVADYPPGLYIMVAIDQNNKRFSGKMMKVTR